MTNVEQLCNTLAKKYDLPYNIAKRLCCYEFKCVAKRMSEYDTKDILLRYLFKIKCKDKYKVNSDERHKRILDEINKSKREDCNS